MKNARRKFFLALICLLMFLFTAPLLVSAEGEVMRAGCTHPATATQSGKEYLMDDAAHHQCRTIWTTYCTVCNAVIHTTEGTYHSEPHSLSLSDSESYHSEVRHFWIYNCPCGYSKDKISPCSGPPCSSPMSLDEPLPCEHSAISNHTVRVPVPEISDAAYCFATTTSCEDCGATLSTTQGPSGNPARARSKTVKGSSRSPARGFFFAGKQRKELHGCAFW